jgi:hypothetical protein
LAKPLRHYALPCHIYLAVALFLALACRLGGCLVEVCLYGLPECEYRPVEVERCQIIVNRY